MMPFHRRFALFALTAAVMLLSGCMPEIAATNPYDPATPLEQQKKADVTLTVYGAMTNDEAPVALADVEIRLADGPSQSGSDFETDTQGVAQIVDLVPGTYQFFVWHPQYGPPKPGQTYWVTLEPGESKSSDVYLAQVNVPSVTGQPVEYTLTGTALKAGELSRSEEATRDHSGISVRVRTEDETPTSIETTTDATGAFGLALNPGTYTLYFNAPDHTETGPVTAVIATGEAIALPEPVVLNINPGRIDGRIVLEGVSDDGHSDIVVSLKNTSFTAITDTDGSFQLADLPAGTYTLRATKDNYDAVNLPGVVIRGGQSTDLDDLMLLKSKGGLTGQFTLAGAQTSQGVQVSLTDTTGSLVSSAITDASGEFRFTDVPVGEYTIEACKQGYLPPREGGAISVSANQEQTTAPVIINRPVIVFPQFAQEVRTNDRTWQLEFNVPTDRVKAVQVTGEATILNESGAQLDDQNQFVPFLTEGQSSHITVQLGDREGPLLIQVSFRGDDCYLSETYSLIVNLDRTGPTLLRTHLLEGEYTNTRTATLALEGFDADEMLITSNDVDSVGGDANGINAWIAASDEVTLRLSEGDGAKTINVQTRDAAGNTSNTLTNTIVLDTQAPTDATVSIDETQTDDETGATYVEQSTVTLSLTANDPPAQQLEMRHSNDSSFVDAQWVPYTVIVPNWRLLDPDTDGVKTIYTQIRDISGNAATPNETISTQIELDTHGTITVQVNLTSLDNILVTDATIYLDGTAVGNPDATGALILEGIDIHDGYTLSAALPNHTLVGEITVDVGARSTTPEHATLELKYNTGTLSANIALEGLNLCPTVDDINGTNLQVKRASVLVTDLTMNPDGCELAAELNVGLAQIELSYPGFMPHTILADIPSAQAFSPDPSLIELKRATGSVSGIVKLQGVSSYSGIQIEAVPASDDGLPSYTATTTSNGAFNIPALWAGQYHVWAQKDGYTRIRIGENITVSQDQNTDTGEHILGQQTGDFFINGGNEFTTLPEVQLSLEFENINLFRFRINGEAFSDWVAWDDNDSDGIMTYGVNGEVRVPDLSGEGDNGDRIIEIETQDTNGDLSGAPYYQASIRLDTIAPVGTRLLFTGASITTNGETTYTNSEFGEVSLDLSADDANWIPDVPGVSRVKLCEVGAAEDACESRIWSPIMTYELPNRDVNGLKSFYALFIDPAGNVSAPLNAEIILDTLDPAITALQVIDAQGEPCVPAADAPCYVNERQIELRLTESFDPALETSDARSVWAVVDDPNFLTGTWSAYAPDPGANIGSISLNVPSSDGSYTVYVQTKDAAQNTSQIQSITVQLDTTPPPAPAVAESFQYVSTHEVSVAFTNPSDDYTVEHSWDGTFTDVTPQDYATLANVVVFDFLDNTEGTRTLYLRYRDGADNVGTSTQVQAEFDSTPPTVSYVRVNFGENISAEGISVVNSPTGITFEVQCNDRVCTDSVCSGAEAEQLELLITQVGTGQTVYAGAYIPLVTGDILAQEGTAQLELVCTDPAGNASTPATQSVLLDTQSPAAADNQLNINDGDLYTSSLSVSLHIDWADTVNGSGITTMAIANGAIDCDSASYTSVQEDLSWTLPSTEGEVTVSVCLKDRAGNTTSIQDSITIDRVAPTGSIAALLEGGDYSLTKNVSFLVQRDDSDAQRYAVERGAGVVCDNADYQNFEDDDSIEVTLPNFRDGESDVSLCLKDAAGLTNKYVTSVSVDILNPSGFMAINQGDLTTTDQIVTLNIYPSDGVTEMKLVNDNPNINCADDAGYEDISLSVTHTLADNDGERYVGGCLRKASGRFVLLNPVRITLDTTPPVFDVNTDLIGQNGTYPGGLAIDLPGTVTRETALPVIANAIDATSGLAYYKLSEGDACTGGAWVDWPQDNFDRPAGIIGSFINVSGGDREDREVSMMLKDVAGNTSDCVTDSILVDTVALSVTSFVVQSNQDTDETGYTSQTTVRIAEVAVDDPSSCSHYLIEERTGNEEPETIEGCPTGPFPFDLAQGTNGPRFVNIRAIDDVGNISARVEADIILDTEVPQLMSVYIRPGEDSLAPTSEEEEEEGASKFTNERSIIVEVTGSQATNIHYCVAESEAASCAIEDPVIVPFVERVPGPNKSRTAFLPIELSGNDGNKEVCVKLFDEAGNASGVKVCDTIELDTTPPVSPLMPSPTLSGVNASCAYIKTRQNEGPDFWRFEFRQLGAQWKKVGTDAMDPSEGADFDPTDPGSIAPIKFPLTQDTTNFLQVRVVDKAGNVSEPSQAVVEEVSSFLISTDLKIKQTCNGGQYVILKEMRPKPSVVKYANCANFDDRVVIEDAPEIALLDPQSRTTVSLSPPMILGDIDDLSCVYNNLENSVIDAACSPEPNHPMLLVARPYISNGQCPVPLPGSTCETYFDSNPVVGTISELELVVLPDPIGMPNQQLISLNSFDTALRSIDVVKWDHSAGSNDYSFEALVTHGEKNIEADEDGGDISLLAKTHLSKIKWPLSDMSDEIQKGINFATVNFDEGLPLRSLALAGSWANYLKYDGLTWSLKRKKPLGQGIEQTILEYTDVNDDSTTSPMRTDITPAAWLHPITDQEGEALNIDEAGSEFVYVDNSGQALARTPLQTDTEIIGSGAPAGAKFFEVGAGKVAWVDVDDPRILYQSPVYGTNPVQLKYAVDTTLPILPVRDSNLGLGDGYVMYHTTGVTTGIVIAYLDENDTTLDECAE